MISIQITFLVAVFVCGLIGIVLSARDHAFNNGVTWFWVSIWLTCLALLSGQAFFIR